MRRATRAGRLLGRRIRTTPLKLHHPNLPGRALQEELDSQLLAPAPAPVGRAPAAASALPSAPTGARTAPAPKQKTKEELELEALEAEMAL